MAVPEIAALLKYEISSSPSMMATPKSEMKPTAAEMLKLVPVRHKAQTPPIVIAKTLLEHDNGIQPGSQGRIQAG